VQQRDDPAKYIDFDLVITAIWPSYYKELLAAMEKDRTGNVSITENVAFSRVSKLNLLAGALLHEYSRFIDEYSECKGWICIFWAHQLNCAYFDCAVFIDPELYTSRVDKRIEEGKNPFFTPANRNRILARCHDDISSCYGADMRVYNSFDVLKDIDEDGVGAYTRASSEFRSIEEYRHSRAFGAVTRVDIIPNTRRRRVGGAWFEVQVSGIRGSFRIQIRKGRWTEKGLSYNVMPILGGKQHGSNPSGWTHGSPFPLDSLMRAAVSSMLRDIKFGAVQMAAGLWGYDMQDFS
jgi:hypothetical protein